MTFISVFIVVMNTCVDHVYSDIWEYIFEYFNTNELFFSFTNITQAIDEVLMHNKSRFLFRGFILDSFVRTLPENLRLNQVSSLELHQSNSLHIIEQCTALRLLKLIGDSEWIVFILSKILSSQIKIERLILITPGVGSLDKIFVSISIISSLVRLEIYANELEERVQMSSLIVNETNIQRLTLHSCSSISWKELSLMLPSLTNIHSLDITLFQDCANRFSCTFPKLRYLHLTLHELSFKSVLTILFTVPLLEKLKLNGLVDDEEFVSADKWISLFSLCSSLDIVIVHLSLEGNTCIFRHEMIQKALQQINLELKCLDDDNDFFHSGNDQQHWWILSGMIMKHHDLLKKT